MGPRNDDLRDRLLAQQEPAADRLAHYRREVEAMLTRLDRENRWADAVRALLVTFGSLLLFFLSLLFGVVGSYLLLAKKNAGKVEMMLPALIGLVCLIAAIGLLRWFFKRRRSEDLLLEVKRLQVQVLELQEQLRGRGNG